MELENFTLEEYNDSKKDHRTVLIKLWNDEDSKKYLFDLFKEVEYLGIKYFEDNRNNAYIVYMNNEPIGYTSVKADNNRCVISYGLLKEYRGNHLGALLLRELSSKLLLTYSNVDNLVLIIDNKNIGSQKTAISAGYQKESRVKYTKKREI